MRTSMAAALCATIAFAVIPYAERLRAQLKPQLQSGQTLTYLVSYETNRGIKTESRVAIPNLPMDSKVQARGLLSIEVLGLEASGATRMRSRFESLASDTAIGKSGHDTDPAQITKTPAETRRVEFKILSDGTAAEVTGLENL